MTCVVGVVGRKGVLLAGDSQSSDDATHRYDTGAKTFELAPSIAIAYCGSGRLGQLLEHQLGEVKESPLGRDERKWAIEDFVEEVRWVAREHGYLHIREEDQVEELGQSAFLLAVRRRLFSVEPDFSVNEHIYPYEALGSGAREAIGVFHHAQRNVADPFAPLTTTRMEPLARRAIAAAAEFDNYVGGPVVTARTTTYSDDDRAIARRILKAA